MYKNLIIIILNLFLININHAQQSGFCGTTLLDNQRIKDRMLQNRESIQSNDLRVGVITYIPISYWLSAKNDGSGRIRYVDVLLNICALNKIYVDQNIQFYLKGIFDVNNIIIYEDPSSREGEAAINQINSINKNAINIFVTSGAVSVNLGALAYYHYSEDYIVCNGQIVNEDATILAHELGHFFTLVHTYYPWGSLVYDCTMPTPKELDFGSTKVLVEYVDRMKDRGFHCYFSGDGFCDTPADYDQGFGWLNGCVYSGCAKDPDDVPLDPDEKNIMGDFLGCLTYYSLEQKAAIARDLKSTRRDYLRSSVYNPPGDVSSPPINPVVVSSGFNAVTFKWESVPNATFYILEIAVLSFSNKSTYRNYILGRLDTTLTDLLANTKYVWKVTAYNSKSICPSGTNTGTLNYRTSAQAVASHDLESNVNDITVIPIGDYQLLIQLIAKSSGNLTFDIYDQSGKLIRSEELSFISGINSYSRKFEISGIFSYRIYNMHNAYGGKFISY
ncbi:MAG: hypothetical protein ABIO44_01630 [Saprospiraceae bacterium]